MNPNNTSFDKSLQIAKKKCVEHQALHFSYLQSDLSRYMKYIKKVQEQNPGLTYSELEKKILDDFHYNLTPKIFESGCSFENYMDLNSCKYLQTHSKTFDEIWDLINSPDYTPPKSNESFRDYLESYMYYSLYCRASDIMTCASSAFNDDMNRILDSHNGDTNLKLKELEKYIKSSFSDRRIHNELITCAKILCFGPKFFLGMDQKLIEKELKSDLKTSILELTHTLNDIGAYQRYENINDRNLRKFQFPEFQKTPEGVNLYVSLDDLPNYLSNLSIDDLMILNTFWLNRYTKEISAYADCISVMKECDLLEQLLASSETPKNCFSLEQFKTISEKKALLRPLITDFILKQKNVILENAQANETDKKYVTFSYDPLKDYVSDRTYSEKYQKYFSSNPSDDIIFYAYLFNPSIAAYSQKSDYLSALISNIESNREIINSGIIPTSYSNDGTHTNLDFLVGLGIDTQLTYPVREHISLTFLKDFTKSYTGSSIVPIYEGATDFSDPFGNNDSFVSAQLVLPFSSRQIDLLKKTVKSNGYSKFNKNFIQHLLFLSNPKKMPDSFFKEKTLPNGKVKKVFERRFVDLDDGQIYTQTKDGTYVKVEPELKKGKKEEDYGR